MLKAALEKNDVKAKWLIGIFSVIVFAVVVVLGKVKVEANLGFNIHIFATVNAFVNATIAVFLVAALVAVKSKKFLLHKRLMIAALGLSVLFLVSYIAHHMLAGEAKFGDSNHDGLLSDAEKVAAGSIRMVYYIILATHIILATLILPFILFTAYRGLTAEFEAHKKLSKIIWPLWFYVAITGPVVYMMISPYYS